MFQLQPQAKQSKGELAIASILKNYNIEFQREYRFHNQPKEIQKCRYDFYIPQSNTIIEYHGRQHYKFNDYFHKTIDRYLESWHRDILKKEYLEKINVNYIEIKYDDNIHLNLQINNII